MKTKIFLFISLLISATFVYAQGSFFSDVDSFLKKHVATGSVHYSSVKANMTQLQPLVKKIAEMNVSSMDANTKKAFYINAYNILVINQVVQNYPISSPMDVAGFFDSKKQKVAGEMLTLNDIENKKIRAVYKDSRIHFALVCAAKGCPKITNFAYTPDKLDMLLTQQTKAALNDKSFLRIDDTEKKIRISEIFKWYKDDFYNEEGSYVKYMNKYRNTPLPSGYKVVYYTYNWKLNEKKKP